jgi:hypothetical protein
MRCSGSACSDERVHPIYIDGLHPEPHAVAKITLGRRWSQGAVGCEDTVVHEPCSSVELGEEGLDAPAEAVLGVGNGLENSGADDGLERLLVNVQSYRGVANSTYNSGLLVGLTIARAQGLPPDGGVVAAVEDIEGLEGNIGLLAVVCAELFTGSESNGVDDVGTLTATVADDVDGGTPVHEVDSECLLGELKGVALDELLENVGNLCGVGVGQALVALVLALVSVPGTSVTPAPRALGFPVTGSSFRDGHWSGNRSGCSDHGGNHGRSDGDNSCGAHVD